MRIVNLRDNPELLEIGIAYFQRVWGNEKTKMVYRDCISRSILAENPLPIWYLVFDGNEPIGCAGLITNDFISCMDLWPWLCALFVDERYRGRRLGADIISHIREDARKIGFAKLYLCTGHVGYYEKIGFSYICEGYHPWGQASRVYECVL